MEKFLSLELIVLLITKLLKFIQTLADLNKVHLFLISVRFATGRGLWTDPLLWLATRTIG